MNKDVIYIDVEDDITAIISKVKASKEKIVALVPPKRVGVLQSAVNLRLLSRSAEQNGKRLVLITNNHALMSLAAAAKVPSARNLQSKPELAEVTAIETDDGDDVIDGGSLPIGDHADMAVPKDTKKDAAVAAAIGGAGLAEPPKSGERVKSPKSKGSKVPNFNTFRKKLAIGIVAAVLLIGFGVWAIFFAPRATVVVSAKTSDSSINENVTLGEELDTDTDTDTLKATKASKSEQKTVDITATGSKNVGEKATGTVRFSTNNISNLGTTIPAGTRLTASGGTTFLTDEPVTITIDNYQNAPASVTASEQGAKYNSANGSVSGAPSGISADLTGPTSGGTDKVVKIVTSGDVQRARQALVDQEDEGKKAELIATFEDGVKVIDDTYGVDYSGVRSAPAVGEEAESGKGTLSATVVYRIYGIAEEDLNTFLDDTLKKNLESADDQRVYDNGEAEASFQDVEKRGDDYTMTLIATAKVGPKLDEQQIKNDAKGKKGGEVQEALQGVQGIEDVDVRYFPFWVSSVPNDDKKITVQFKVDGDE